MDPTSPVADPPFVAMSRSFDIRSEMRYTCVDGMLIENEFGSRLNALDRDFFARADTLLRNFGYVPKRSKTKDVIFVFARKGRNVAKFALDSHGTARMYLKYYATPDPDAYFQNRIRIVMEEFAFRYAGMIPGAIEGVGYRHRGPDGREYFLFHSEMIDVGVPGVAELTEIERLVARQTAWWDDGNP